MAMTQESRKVDELGRIVLPKSVRLLMDINPGDELLISSDGQKITMEHYATSCIFCGSTEKISDFKGKAVCKKCRKEMSK